MAPSLSFMAVTAFLTHLIPVVALVTPRNNDTTTTDNSVYSGSGMSRLVEMSIIVVLLLSILFLLSLHLFRKWSFFGDHIKWLLCCCPSSTSGSHGNEHARVDHQIAGLDRVTSGTSSITLTSTLHMPPEVQRPPRAQPQMAMRHETSPRK